MFRRDPPADFIAAFTPGHRMADGDWRYTMQVRPAPALVLPSGRIVAGDPAVLTRRVDRPYQRTVPPGTYPVDLAVRRARKVGERRTFSATACLRVRFQDAPVTRWEIATAADEDPAALKPFEIYGYGVDAGMGCFADADALAAARAACAARGESLSDEFYFGRVLPAYTAARGVAAAVELDPATGANLVLCTSGCGDGFYASYWGLGRGGKPVCLVTDFGLLSRHVHESHDLGPLADLVGKERRLNLPGGQARLRFRKPGRNRLVVEQGGSGGTTCEVELRRDGAAVHALGSTVSYRGSARTVEWRFGSAVPADATVVLTYLDRIEPIQ